MECNQIWPWHLNLKLSRPLQPQLHIIYQSLSLMNAFLFQITVLVCLQDLQKIETLLIQLYQCKLISLCLIFSMSTISIKISMAHNKVVSRQIHLAYLVFLLEVINGLYQLLLI